MAVGSTFVSSICIECVAIKLTCMSRHAAEERPECSVSSTSESDGFHSSCASIWEMRCRYRALKRLPSQNRITTTTAKTSTARMAGTEDDADRSAGPVLLLTAPPTLLGLSPPLPLTVPDIFWPEPAAVSILRDLSQARGWKRLELHVRVQSPDTRTCVATRLRTRGPDFDMRGIMLDV